MAALTYASALALAGRAARGQYSSLDSILRALIRGNLENEAVATNIRLGSDALNANTTGANNVAIGYRAMDVNTIGDQHVRLRKQALPATPGNENAQEALAEMVDVDLG